MDEPATELDKEQRRAAHAPAAARQIVLAGPGAGKSQVVGERCRYLIGSEGVYPEEILVASFSNAAVDVVRARTADVVDEGRSVEVATLDALAARIVGAVGDGAPLKAFDQTVALATRLLTRTDEPVFDDVRHLIVDEFQDVVGLRARFVAALLKWGVHTDTGFTLLGDPMQGVYDFQLSDDDYWTAEHFVGQVRLAHQPAEVTLRGEYRTTSVVAAGAAVLRPDLVSATPVERKLLLRGLMARLDPLGELDEETAATVLRWKGSTAFLCDTNARAALTAEQLTATGVIAELASRPADPTLSPWIAQLLAAWDGDVIDHDDFFKTASEHGLPLVEERWRHLNRLADTWKRLDLRGLGDALGGSRVPRALHRRPEASVLVSTVHRAKGLEFDNVVLVDPDEWRLNEARTDAEARLLFVALSRARRRLTRTRGVETKRWRKDKVHDAWVRRSPRGRGALAVIVEPRHTRTMAPLSVDVSKLVGCAVSWEPTEWASDGDGDEFPVWAVMAGQHEIARTSADFGDMIRGMSFSGALPRLSGARVVGLETVAGTPVVESLGKHGFWLGARISGPVSFNWE